MGTLMRCSFFAVVVMISLAGFPGRTVAQSGTVTNLKDSGPEGARTRKSQLAENYGRLPLSFEANAGQTDPRVTFLSRGASHTLFLTSAEAVLVLARSQSRNLGASATSDSLISSPATVLRMKLLGATRQTPAIGLERLPGISNYFIGNDPTKWQSNVPTYGKVRFGQVYPGVDLIYYGNQTELEYDFVVSPGADPAQIRLAIQGAEKVSIDPAGNAVLQGKDGDIRLQRPHLYQEVHGQKVEIAGGYVLKGHQLRFQVAPYDRRETLVIDPVLSYSTYLGGSTDESGNGITVDVSGNAYVTGITSSANFPVSSGAPQSTNLGQGDVFIAKLNSAGSALVYSTYLGGSGLDLGLAIAVDASGNAYATGYTNSTNFPVSSGAFQNTFGGGTYNAFVTKLNAAGTALAYSTYLGGSGLEFGTAIAVDSSGNAYVTGNTSSANFPLASPFQSSIHGGTDAFVTKLNDAGSGLVYSTYLGGTGNDGGYGIAVDSAGNAYVAGLTSSTNFPLSNALQSANAGGAFDVFVLKLNAAGNALVYSTYLGGSGDDEATALALDSAGNAYVTGFTNSTNFPVSSASFQRAYGGGAYDVFIAKLNATGTALGYSTYLGGSGDDEAYGIAVDASGNAYVTGCIDSTNFPLSPSPLQPANGGGNCDAFVTELNAAGSALVYSTYLGGSDSDSGNAIAVDAAGSAYVAGITSSSNFPLSSPLQSTNLALATSGSNAFITKLSNSTTGSTPTSITLGSSPSTSAYGENITLTALVSSSGGAPTGTVSFVDSSINLGSAPISRGQATFSVSSLAPGSHFITATYGGDATFAASSSTPQTQTVTQAGTTITLGSSSASATFAQNVTFTASVMVVTPGAGTPTGNVSFQDGQSPLGSVALSSSGTASISTSSLPAGSHAISAAYQGDSNFQESISAALAETVNWPAPYQGPPSFLTLPVGTGPIAMTLNSVTGRMYVANQGSNSVTVLDLASNSTITTISVGKAPSAIAVNSQTNMIYVADRDSVDVAVIDGNSNSVTFIPVPSSLAPDAITVNPVTNKIYVGTGSDGVLVMIDGGTNQVSRPDPTALFGPIAFGISPLSGRIYVADSRDSDVEEYEGATNFLLNGFSSNTPQALAVNPPSIYVADGGGSVEVIDETSKLNLIRVIVGNNPYAIAANPVDNTVYVATQSVVAGQAGGLVAIDGASKAVTANYTLGQTAVPARVPAPNKIAVDSSANLIYVANEASNDVTVIDGAVHTVLANVPVGSLPSALMLDPIRCNVYVANFGSGNLTVIQPSINGPGVCLSPTALVFGPQAIGTTSAPQTITLTNIGNSTLSITSVVVSGDFTGTGSCAPVSPATSTRIAPGGQCTIQATSMPTVPGVRNGQITITDNAGGSLRTITLTGDGVSPTTTQLAITPNPVVYGQALSLSAKVVASQGIPTGTVTFFVDSQSFLGISKLASDGSASFNTAFPFLEPVGSQHTITAVYNGDITFGASSSAAMQLVVNQASTTIASMSVTPLPSTSPQSLHTQVDSVAPGGGVPTGSVVFQEGQSFLSTVALDSHGSATTPAYFAGGQHSISVSYQGDSNFLPGSSPQPLLVNVPISTVTSLRLPSAVVTYGMGVTFTATVTASTPTGGNLNGTVIFWDGPTFISSSPFSGTTTSGTVVTSASTFPLGQHSITAEYRPGGIFLGSKSVSAVLTVTPGGPGTPSCACSLTGAYVAPATPVDPSSATLSPQGNYTVTANINNSSPAGTSLSIKRNADQVVVFPLQNFPITTNFGFSPDDDRFVLHNPTGSSDNVQLYDLTVQPARILVSDQSPSGTTSTALSFSPSGRYFMYEFVYRNGGTPIARFRIYQVQNVASQLLIYDSGDFPFVSAPGSKEDNFGVLGQGFSPDNPETSFVYSNVTGQGQTFGQSQSKWNLVSLVTPQTVLRTFTLAEVSDIWEYSPCGDVIALSRQLQPQATGASNVDEVDLTSTATGLALNPGGYMASSINLSFACTSTEQDVLDTSQPQPAVVFHVPNVGCSNTPTGSTVTVLPRDAGGSGLAPVTITLSNVTVPGLTTLVASSSGPQLPANTQPGNPVKYFYLTTTATFSSANVCISYADLTFGSASIILLHNKNGTWEVPPNQTIDTVHQTICATVSSFSPFAIAEQVSSPTVSSISAPSVVYGAPASVTVSVSSLSGTVSGSVTLSVDGGAASSSALRNGSAVFNAGVLNAGPHSLSAGFMAQGNLSASSAAGTLIVAQAPLTITANNATRPYGAANPTFSANFSGFVNGDSNSVLTGLLNCGTTALTSSPVGAHPIACSGLSSPNYAISFVNGMLNVVPEATSLTVTISPPSIVVGQSATVTVTLTAPDMVFPINPSVLASVAVTSPIVSDILTGNAACALAPTGVGMATCTVTLTAVEPNGRTLNASFPGTANLAASNNLANLIVTAPLESKVSCLKSDFRNVAVPGGSYLWLNSIFKIRDVNKQKVTITFFQSSVQFQYPDASKNLITVNQALPDAKIVIDPGVSTASTVYDAVDNVWITTVPFDLDDATFLTGIPWLVPAGGIPADIEPVTWCGTFASDTAGVDMGWRWSAAAYSSFTGDSTVLGVKPMNTDHDNAPANRDNAGTPENFKASVIPGARGKGGKNYTGSYSGSAEIE